MEIKALLQVGKQHPRNRITFLFLQADDLADVFGREPERFAACDGMLAHDGVHRLDELASVDAGFYAMDGLLCARMDG